MTLLWCLCVGLVLTGLVFRHAIQAAIEEITLSWFGVCLRVKHPHFQASQQQDQRGQDSGIKGCAHRRPLYTAKVTLNWKSLQMAILGLLLVLVTGGCSGISASPSVSPATFLLPGIGAVQPPRPAAEDGSNRLLAFVP